MMSASINIGVFVGEGTMIDMNVVVGEHDTIGINLYISTGTVIIRVAEPPSAQLVIMEDDVVIGANAIVLEGRRSRCHSWRNHIEDVAPYTVVAETPAHLIKEIKQELRQL